MQLFDINLKPDKNPKPDKVKPEPYFENWQKPDPSPDPAVETRAGPEPDYLKPVASLPITKNKFKSIKLEIKCEFIDKKCQKSCFDSQGNCNTEVIIDLKNKEFWFVIWLGIYIDGAFAA